ncbi:hypothetical protein GCM10009718_05750 [Isoptericola halotolerans]|uniref:N-acetyl-1-D-myo-inositol-2-amino-2-deoxy-alpha-D-glucopyranoside deacetylase n=1 Tax=Isoptericola halotolerans TaxID=300560 RepID=A0ABX2A0Z5_9MICO|nr:hypothetical protein [Isoptericola halotolerans]
MSSPAPYDASSAPHHASARPAGPPGGRALAGRAVLALLLGAAVGVIGTVAHRVEWAGLPAGLALALTLTASTAVLCRAWSGAVTLLATAAGWFLAVQVLSASGPGGDVLVPAQTVGYVWTYGGLALLAAPALLPRSWFVDDGGDGAGPRS